MSRAGAQRMPWWLPAATIAGEGAVRLLGRSWRIVHGPGYDERDRALRAGERCIYALWHARLLMLTYTHRARDVAVLISRHHDGEWIARIVERLGYATARGSSTRGGDEGLRELIEHARAGRLIAVTPDGPRGPAERVKPGVAYLASRTGLPVLPIAAAGHPAWRARSWDGFRVPHPFARVAVACGEPIAVPPGLDAAALEPWRARIEAELAAVTAATDHAVTMPPGCVVAGVDAERKARVSAAWVAYRALAPAAAALADGAAALALGAARARWAERTGRVACATGCDAWIHAASLGETLAVGPLARALVARDAAARVRLTAMTATGRARLVPLGLPVSLAPLDAPRPVARFLAATEPRRILLLETELWPHWLLAARARRIPVAVVSARLSDRSLPRYARLGAAFRALVGGLGAVLCQSARDAERWAALGADPARVAVVGNLKSDALPRPVADRATARGALGLDAGRALLTLGSLRPGEAGPWARAWAQAPPGLRDAWQVVAVPRHAAAAAELRAEAARAGVDGGWRWDERPGVLAGYYAASEAAFVGGSLAPFGGHNPLEPAAAGAAVLMGPHHASQAEGVAALEARGAIEIVTADSLAAALARLLADPARLRACGAAAAAVVESQRGVAERAVERLAALGLWPAR